jgi:hypothetical protein
MVLKLHARWEWAEYLQRMREAFAEKRTEASAIKSLVVPSSKFQEWTRYAKHRPNTQKGRIASVAIEVYISTFCQQRLLVRISDCEGFVFLFF